MRESVVRSVRTEIVQTVAVIAAVVAGRAVAVEEAVAVDRAAVDAAGVGRGTENPGAKKTLSHGFSRIRTDHLEQIIEQIGKAATKVAAFFLSSLCSE